MRSAAVLAVFAWCGVGAASAGAQTSQQAGGAVHANNSALGVSFDRVGVTSGALLASGDYVLLSEAGVGTSSPAWIVINDRLGTTTALDPQCTVLAAGPPWLLMRCPSDTSPTASPATTPPDVDLYSLADGTRRTVTLSPGMAYCSSPPFDSEVSCSAVAVGADWIEWVGSSYHHLPTQISFQNIQTDELRRDPSNSTTFADLNSPALARTTCPGVQVPAPDPFDGSGAPLVSYEGPFALVTDTTGDALLERCGTHMRRRLLNASSASFALAWSAGAIVRQSVAGRLDGLFLPSLRTFTVPLPRSIVRPRGAPRVTPVLGLALTPHGLYVRDGWTGTVWRTANPADLPRAIDGPRVIRSAGRLACLRGRWRNAARFSYAWRVNRTTHRDARPTLSVALGGTREPRTVSCSVTAANALGTTTASSPRLHLR